MMAQEQTFLYQQVSPGGLLAPYVDCFWVLQAPAHISQEPERLPADGQVDVMFHLAAPLKRYRADGQGEPHVQRRSAILGGRSQGYVDEQLGAAHYVAIRFRPGGLAPFIPFPLTDLVDQTVDLDLIWGPAVQRWEEQLFEATSLEQQSHILTRALLSRFEHRPNHRAIQSAVQRIDTLGGNASIRALADHFGWSQKHFERLFAQYVGFVPKRYARISRLHHLSNWAARQSHGRNMGQLAADFGYYDQSHMVKEVTGLTGVAPGEFFSTWCAVCRRAPAHLQVCRNRYR